MSKQLEIIRENLENTRKQLLKELGSKTEQDDSVGQDKEGAAIAYQEINKMTAYASTIEERLAEVEDALSKFGNGTYGLCSACNQPIPPARLAALPHATLCIDCKAAVNKTG